MKKSSEKITLKDFLNSEKRLAINCDTLEKADIYLEKADIYLAALDKKISSLLDAAWFVYEEKTCFINKTSYANISYCRRNRIKIYEFKDVILEEK